MSILHYSLVFSLALTTITSAQLSLGSAGVYGVFAASTITSTGLTVVNGRLGLDPGTSITGFPLGVATGEDINNAQAIAAKTDIQSAYNALAAMPVTTDLSGQNLGGLTLTSGVYGFSSSGSLTGILILDAQNNPDALFVFQFGSTLITGSVSAVVLLNGAQACNVYWQVGSSATLGTGTAFLGILIAQASITATTGVTVLGGGLYTITAAVTLDTNIIDPLGSCGGVILPSTTTTSGPTSSKTGNPTASSTTNTDTLSSITTSITTAAPVSTTTSVTTVTVTNPASTTTITVSDDSTVTVTSTVSTSTSTCTSTSTEYSTSTKTKTGATSKCATTSSLAKRGKPTSTKTKTLTTTCAKYTVTKGASATATKKIIHTATSTKWKTTTATTTSTYTHTPACTSAPKKVRRSHQRMLE